MLGVLLVKGAEHLVYCVEERAADMATAVPCPLRQSYEVINKYVHVRQEVCFAATQVWVAGQFGVFC